MVFIDWVSNSEILQQLKILGKQMSETQEKIDALTEAVHELDDLPPDEVEPEAE